LLDVLSGYAFGINGALVITSMLAAAVTMLAVYVLSRALWQRESAAIASLLCVTVIGGLDVIPSLASYALSNPPPLTPFIHLDGWDGCWSEVSTFMTLYTWVPQHVLSLGALLLGLLIYQATGPGFRSALCVAVILAAAAGYSIYVPLAAAGGIALHAAIVLAHAVRTRSFMRKQKLIWPWAGAGILGLGLIYPLATYEVAGRPAGANFPFEFWIRTGGLPIWGLPSATVFQWLFPAGGYVSQGLDLPLYFIVEFGLTLMLAGVGLVGWRIRMVRKPWPLMLCVATISLLIGVFVHSTLGCNDLGMREVLPLQAWLVLAAGGGLLALRDPELAASNGTVAAGLKQAQTMIAAKSIRNIVVASSAGCLGVLLAYQLPFVYRTGVGSADRFIHYMDGMYAAEADAGTVFGWTQKRLGLTFVGIPQDLNYQVVVYAAAGSRPNGAPPASTVVWVNGFAVGQFVAAETFQSYAFDVPVTVLQGSDAAHIELAVQPYYPSAFGSGDQRELGLLIGSIALIPTEVEGPTIVPPWNVLLGSLVLLCASSLLFRFRWPWTIVLIAIVVTLLLARSAASSMIPYFALAASAVLIVRAGASWLSQAIADRLEQRRLSVFWFLGVPFFMLGLLTTAWQIYSFDVGKFLPSYNATAAEEDRRSLAYADMLQFIHTQTAQSAVLQLDPKLMAFEGGLGLATERPNYFYLDQVFIYQFAPGRIRTRVDQVREAFEMPTMPEACDRFRRLKINLILVDLTSHYPWLADTSETNSCLRPLHENSVVYLLNVENSGR
jgi:hypothetical protein